MVSVAMLLVLVILLAAGVPFGVAVSGDGYSAGGKHKVIVMQVRTYQYCHAYAGSIFGAYGSDCTDGGTIGSSVVYGRGILVNGGISSGAHGIGNVESDTSLLRW